MTEIETDVVVVGDGPGGLQAALLTAKNGLETHVIGTDETAMHKAYLYNYLGIEEIHGSEFMDVARDQAQDVGATLHEAEVASLEPADGAYAAATGDGSTVRGTYLVLASGRGTELAEPLGVDVEDGVVAADRDAETSVDDVYAVGWIARPQKIQAAISVGDGAAAALDILSKEKGEPFHDFDTP
jgi:thioredoxin reductase